MLLRAALVLAGLVLIAAAPAAPDTRAVKVKDNYFSPQKRSAEAGDVIRFKWVNAYNPHTVKFTRVPGGAKKPASCKVRVTGKCERKVKKAGVYYFKCTIHGDTADKMRGRIVVD
jgi:plastocyanin